MKHEDPVRHEHTKARGLVARIIAIISGIIGVLMTSFMLGLIFEWLYMLIMHTDATHSRIMMAKQLNLLADDFKQSLLHSYPLELSQYLLAKADYYLFTKSGIKYWLEFNQVSNNSFYLALKPYFESVLYTFITVMAKSLVLFFSIPLFIMMVIVGAVDGLVKRDLRKFTSGYESSFIYHRVKKSLLGTLILGVMLYLIIPIYIHPNLIFLPCAIILCINISLTVSNFKKYL